MPRPLSAQSPSLRRGWLSTVRSELTESYIASNVVIVMLLIGVEKLLEMEFACPCEPHSNACFALAYFICPVIIVLALKICFGKLKCEWKHLVISGFKALVPAVMWIVLLFLDGQYYACAKTNWSGRFVIIDKAAPQKWCEPTNNTSSQELMVKTQMWFFESQRCGILLLVLSVIVFGGLHKLYKLCKSGEQGEEDETTPMYPSLPVPGRPETCLDSEQV